jgi:hypothetical protein
MGSVELLGVFFTNSFGHHSIIPEVFQILGYTFFIVEVTYICIHFDKKMGCAAFWAFM